MANSGVGRAALSPRVTTANSVEYVIDRMYSVLHRLHNERVVDNHSTGGSVCFDGCSRHLRWY